MKKGILIILLLCAGYTMAQNTSNSIESILSSDPLESVTLNTDRDIYLSGEKIWFKAFCLNKNKTSKIKLSKVLYVELFNNSRKSIIKQKFTIDNGIAQGVIEIPQEFLSGNYYLRAYTQFLKNYPADNYFTTLITIINPEFPLPKNIIESTDNQIDIVPEFGILIEDISTKIAYRINHNLLEDLKEAVIVDDENNIVTSSITMINGCGIFEITPNKSKAYFLHIILKDNDTIVKSLPTIIPEGIAIQTSFSEENNLVVSIINKNVLSDQSQKYLLSLLSSTNQVLSEKSIIASNEITVTVFPSEILKSGVNYVRLKDIAGNIIQYSAFYKNDYREIILNFDLQKKSYSPREMVSINFSAFPSSNLSVSIVKKGTYNQFPSYIFDSQNLLRSYCQNNDHVTLNKNQKDILMILYNKLLSSRNSRFDTAHNRNINFDWIPEIRNVSISGIVYDKVTKLPKPNIPVYISVFNKNQQIHISTSHLNGEFIFSLNNLEGNQNIYLSPKNVNEKELELKINNDFSSDFPVTSNIPLDINISHESLLSEMFINQQTNSIYELNFVSKQLAKVSYPINIREPQISILLDDFIDTPTLETVFREIIPFCSVRRNGDDYSLHIINNLNSFYSEDPLILIDDIPVFNVNELLKVHPSKIEKIEINYTSMILGDYIINGVISLTTETDNFGGIQLPEGSIFLEYQTISPSFKFEAPLYDSKKSKSNRIADFRTLLYWNPDLNTTQNTAISFFTSDHCSEYDVIVRGYTSDGEKCYGKISFSVENN